MLQPWYNLIKNSTNRETYTHWKTGFINSVNTETDIHKQIDLPSLVFSPWVSSHTLLTVHTNKPALHPVTSPLLYLTDLS